MKTRKPALTNSMQRTLKDLRKLEKLLAYNKTTLTRRLLRKIDILIRRIKRNAKIFNPKLACFVLGVLGSITASAQFNDTIDVEGLNAANGFYINGIDTADVSGAAVDIIGDINKDGFDDVIIGANQADPNGISGAGETYIVFGDTNGISSIDCANLDGSNGFTVIGNGNSDFSGISASKAGDFNGDGYDDFLIGEKWAEAGKAHLIFGAASFPSTFDLSNINGQNGITFEGINNNDWFGIITAPAGDFNKDGLSDILISAPQHSGGEVYVVFGDSTLNSSPQPVVNLLNGTDGFNITNNTAFGSDWFGSFLSGIGDFNGDGFEDIGIGNGYYMDRCHVIFGDSVSSSSMEVNNLSAGDGFSLLYESDWNNFILTHSSVSGIDDSNGDGFDDILVALPYRGESYVIYGQATNNFTTDSLVSLKNLNGVELNGGLTYSMWSGHFESLSNGIGDFNGDGYGDVLSGERIFFGNDWNNGVVLKNMDAASNPYGIPGGKGDVNGDGIDDIILGDRSYAANAVPNSGRSFVIYGRKSCGDTTIVAVTLNGNSLNATQSGATYQWLDCNNGYSKIVGATSQSYTPSSSGNYAVEVTYHSCVDTSKCESMITTNTVNNELGNGIIIYPNPVSNGLSIDAQGVIINAVRIVDVAGKLLYQDYKASNNIDLSFLPKGVYFLRIETEDEILNTKLIKN